MRKLLIALAIVVLVLAVALGIFLATFDADRYRSLLISQLAQSLGRPVQLAHLSLGWDRGIALRIRDFAIPDAEPSAEPLIQVEAASALVRLWPLLQRDVQVGAVVLVRPRIHVVRDAQGRINLIGLAALGAPAAADQTVSTAHGTVSFSVDSVHIEDGVLHWTDAMSQPPMEVRLSALTIDVRHISPSRPMDLDLRGALGTATPNIHLSGRLTLPQHAAAGQAGGSGSLERLSLAINQLPLEIMLPKVAPGAPQLHGTLTATVQGDLPTLEPASFAQRLSGQGSIKLTDGRLSDLNLLRHVFERLSMIPGLMERLQQRLPPEYQQKLQANDTILEPIAGVMQVEAGALRFNHLDIRTDEFGLASTGSVGLDGVISIQSMLRIAPALSEALIRSVNELQALTNRRGELEMPLAVQGRAPQITVLPDLRYIASKVAVTTVIDLLGQVLRKSDHTQNADRAENPEGAPASPTPAPAASPLDQLLQRALRRADPSSESQSP